jgi:hypothetical protein
MNKRKPLSNNCKWGVTLGSRPALSHRWSLLIFRPNVGIRFLGFFILRAGASGRVFFLSLHNTLYGGSNRPGQVLISWVSLLIKYINHKEYVDYVLVSLWCFLTLHCSRDECITGNRSWLLAAFPKPKIIIVKIFWCTPVTCKICKFLAVHQVGLMTLCECRVDCPFPYHVTRCWVRTELPPLQYRQWVAYLNRIFGA